MSNVNVNANLTVLNYKQDWNILYSLSILTRLHTKKIFAQLGGGCRMQRLHLCSVLDMPQNNLRGMRGTPSLPSLPGQLRSGMVALDRALSVDQIELNCVLRVNWIAWNRTVLTCKLRTYAKLNRLKWNSFWHWNCTTLNRIVWNRTVLTFNCA